jgi:putative acetyltransferase
MIPDMSVEIKKYDEKYRGQLVAVWEKSVRATHHFVASSDIAYFKAVIEVIDFNAFEVRCLMYEEALIGFIGVADAKIEMLFLDPDFIGLGYGKKLMDFGIEHLKANQVDVNEQNTHAVAFYTSFGFKIVERTALDADGKPYPILKMKRG